MDYTTGTRIEIHNEVNVTPEFVLKEANTMWNKCKKAFKERNMALGDREKADKLMSELRRDHKKFCTSYPIVLRYMAEMQLYHHKAFDKFLKKIKIRPWKTEEEYLDAAADYVVLLFKETNKGWNAKQITNVRQSIRNILQDEHDQFKRYHDEIDKEVSTDEDRFKREKKEELVEFLERAGNELKFDGSMRPVVETADGKMIDAPILDISTNAEIATTDGLTYDKITIDRVTLVDSSQEATQIDPSLPACFDDIIN